MFKAPFFIEGIKIYLKPITKKVPLKKLKQQIIIEVD